MRVYCRGFDDEMRAVVARNLEGRGINLHPRTNLTEVLNCQFYTVCISFIFHQYLLLSTNVCSNICEFS